MTVTSNSTFCQCLLKRFHAFIPLPLKLFLRICLSLPTMFQTYGFDLPCSNAETHILKIFCDFNICQKRTKEGYSDSFYPFWRVFSKSLCKSPFRTTPLEGT